MIKDFLENLKGHNKLTNHVIDYYIDESVDYDSTDDLLRSMEDLQKYGCVSGMIGELIYYDDTIKFFDEYKEEINEMLSYVIEGTGSSMEELFGDKFDKDDPLVIDYSNKNLLAWFGFEETVNNLYENIYEKLKNNNLDYEY
ncbi:MAG: hypothetical protein ACI4OT_04270 [Bacilli bacterium]